jgi:hypothetical protein
MAQIDVRMNIFLDKANFAPEVGLLTLRYEIPSTQIDAANQRHLRNPYRDQHLHGRISNGTGPHHRNTEGANKEPLL